MLGRAMSSSATRWGSRCVATADSLLTASQGGLNMRGNSRMTAFRLIAIAIIGFIAMDTHASSGAYPLAAKVEVPAAATNVRYRAHIAQPNLDVRFRRHANWDYSVYPYLGYPSWGYPSYIPGFRYGGF
jgi:hypothetical protein